VYHLFVVLSERRKELQTHLLAHNIESLIHYPIPAHRQPSLKGVAQDRTGLQKADAHSQQCLSIPCAPHLTETDTLRVIEAINSFRPL
jgi:dTDP-4-amino-4,6-dideoxygalactose transaminase